MLPENLRSRSIYFAILAAGIAARAVWLTQPFVDGWSWRQADVAMIARNFFLEGYDILHPRIDWSAHTSGVVGTEFPLIPFLAALLYPLTGVQEWVGRAISLAFWALSYPFFYSLVRRIYGGEQLGLFAAAAYSFVPLSVMAGRSFMPDMAALCLVLIGMDQLLNAMDSGRSRAFVLATLALGLGLLVKLPYVIVGIPLLAVLLSQEGFRVLLDRRLLTVAAISLLPSAGWYWHASRIPTAELVMGSGDVHVFGAEGFGISSLSHYLAIAKLTFTESLTPLVSIAAAFGAMVRPRSGPRLFHWWLAALLLFVFLVGPGNRHPWYQLPIVPIAAAFAGAGLARATELARVYGTTLSARANSVALVLALWTTGLAFASLRYLQPLYAPQGAESYVQAGEYLAAHTPQTARVVIVDDGVPIGHYYSSRKGWHFWNPVDDEDAIRQLDAFKAAGAEYLVIGEHHLWWLTYYEAFVRELEQHSSVFARGDNYLIYQLRPVPTGR